MSSSSTPSSSAGVADPPKKADMRPVIRRGIKRPSPLGTGLFIGLRCLDPLLQYGILARGLGTTLLSNLGIKTLPPGPPVITETLLDRLHLSPYRLILVTMSAASAAKQIYWLVTLSHEEMPPKNAAIISAFNALLSSLNSLLFICARTSASANGQPFPQTPLLVGAGLFAVGLLTEAVAETQRAAFKRKSGNEGRLYTSGLFALARHVNYGGYTVWRVGYAMAAGGWVWGALVGAWFVADFTRSAVPELSQYCADKYGAQWEQYKSKTPYKLIPYIY